MIFFTSLKAGGVRASCACDCVPPSYCCTVLAVTVPSVAWLGLELPRTFWACFDLNFRGFSFFPCLVFFVAHEIPYFFLIPPFFSVFAALYYYFSSCITFRPTSIFSPFSSSHVFVVRVFSRVPSLFWHARTVRCAACCAVPCGTYTAAMLCFLELGAQSKRMIGTKSSGRCGA